MIIIEPASGLANRMRVVASAMSVAKLSKEKIKLVWIATSDLNCEFTDLFSPIANIEVSNVRKNYKYVKASNQENIIKRILASLINKSVGVDYCIKDQDFSKYIWNEKISVLDLVAKHRNIYFKTCEELNFDKNIECFSQLKPVQEIQDIIDEQTALLNQHTIGIHIRRSDNIQSIQQSPTRLFVESISLEIEKNNNASFFLATDDTATEQVLKEKFGTKIITYKKELSRNSKKGICDAVVDLYCLSKTRYIYGSYWSSFSDIAARLGKIKLITLKI